MKLNLRSGAIYRLIAALVFLRAIQVQAQMNPWVRHDPKKNHGVIVFVHGVMGDEKSTWTSGNAYWPEMLTHDPAFDGQDIYAYHYPSPADRETFSIDQVADNMRLVLTTDGVLQHDEITFVSHSLGGIVTRAFILKYRYVVPKIRLLFFFATPTTGSPYATLAGLLSRNKQFRELYPMKADSYLAPLQSAWLAAGFGIKSYCAYETQPLYGQIIVDLQSATNLCTQRLDPIDADHITIVKPKDQSSTSYLALKAAFVETAPPPPVAPKHAGINHPVVPATPPRPALARLIEYQPEEHLSVILPNERRLVLAVSQINETNADFLVRFTDEHGNNRDAASEEALKRKSGPSFDSDLRAGMANFGGDLGHGGAFVIATKSDVPGQLVCNTVGPLYRGDADLAAARLSIAYDSCFGVSTMSPALSLAFPAYNVSWSNYPVNVAAPVVIDRMIFGLEHPGNVRLVTVVMKSEDFPVYSQVLANRLQLQLKATTPPKGSLAQPEPPAQILPSASKPPLQADPSSTATTINNAPGGFAVSGGTLDHPSITNNNYGPPERIITAAQKIAIIASLGPAPLKKFSIICDLQDLETCKYAHRLAEMFSASDPVWAAQRQAVIPDVHSGYPDGLILLISPKDTASPPAEAIRVYQALHSAGVEIRLMSEADDDPIGEGNIELFVGGIPKHL